MNIIENVSTVERNFIGDFHTQDFDAGLPADILGEFQHGPAEVLPPKSRADINLIEQSELTVKLQAEGKGQHEISGRMFIHQNDEGAAQTGIAKEFVQSAAGDFFVPYEVLVLVELAHHLDQQGRVFFAGELEVGGHVRDLDILQAEAAGVRG